MYSLPRSPVRNFMEGDSMQYNPMKDFIDHSHEQNVSRQFCNKENMNSCLVYLNQELVGHGMNALFNDLSDFHISHLINSTFELLQKIRHSVSIRESLQESKHKAVCEVEQLQAEKRRLKVKLDSTERDLNIYKNKMDLFTKEITECEKKSKNEKEEVRNLQATLKSREVQYKKAMKKDEREMSRLREKLGSLLSEKTGRKTDLKISESLLKSEGRRGQWNSTTAQRDTLQGFEGKQAVLLQENHTLRADMKYLYEILCAINTESCDLHELSSGGDEDRTTQSTLTASSENNFLSHGSFEMPYLLSGEMLMEKLGEQIKRIQQKFGQTISFESRRSILKDRNDLPIKKSQSSKQSFIDSNKVKLSAPRNFLVGRPKSALYYNNSETRTTAHRSQSSLPTSQGACQRAIKSARSKYFKETPHVNKVMPALNETSSSNDDCEDKIKKPRRLIRSESYTILRDDTINESPIINLDELNNTTEISRSDLFSHHRVINNNSSSEKCHQEMVLCGGDSCVDDDDYI